MVAICEPMDIVSSIVDASPVGMLLFDIHGELVFSNRKARTIFGYRKEELQGIAVKQLIPKRFRSHHQILEHQFIRHPKPRSMGVGRRLCGLKKDGTEIPLEVGLSPIDFNDERYVLASVMDISDRVRATALEQANRELTRAATHDALTGLPNRRLLMEFAENLRLLAIRNNSRFTMMFIDLDGFKNVNDSYGHRVGDLLLCRVAKALARAVRKSDIIGRYGGDEFLMCFAGNESFENAEKTAHHILAAIQSIKTVNKNRVCISASIGVISTMTPQEMLVENMIQQADGLMYLAKGSTHKKVVTCENSSLAHTFFEHDIL